MKPTIKSRLVSFVCVACLALAGACVDTPDAPPEQAPETTELDDRPLGPWLPATPIDVDVCDALIEHAFSYCIPPGTPQPTEQDKIEVKVTCRANGGNGNHEDFRRPLVACIQELTGCDEASMDACYLSALSELAGPLDDASALESCADDPAACRDVLADAQLFDGELVIDCFDRWETCGVSPMSDGPFWNAEFCLSLLAHSDADREDAAACLANSCDGVENCLLDTGAGSFPD